SPVATAFLGHVYARSGCTGEGVSLLTQALAEPARMGFVQSSAHIGEAYLLADQVANAHLWADRAVTLARERGARDYHACAPPPRGRGALRPPPPRHGGGGNALRRRHSSGV